MHIQLFNEHNELEIWKKMMYEYDLKYFTEYQRLSESDLEQIREDWKAMRRYALYRLNQDLDKIGKNGQLLNVDVEDSELYPYLDNKVIKFSGNKENLTLKQLFFKYSRILDFKDGYKPKNLILITKGLN